MPDILDGFALERPTGPVFGAAFNLQLATAMSSAAAVATEVHVVATVARRAELPTECEGHFTKGGADANITPLICALTTASDGFAGHCTCAFPGQPAVYISAESHLAWFKIADQRNGARIASAWRGRRSGGHDAALQPDPSLMMRRPLTPVDARTFMPFRSETAALFAEVGQEQHKTLAPLSDDLGLFETGLGSMHFAIIVARLEDRLGVDLFAANEDFPVTFGDLVRLYEHVAS
jgi:hypothetical protein